MHLKNPVHPGEILKHDFVIPMALDVTGLAKELSMPLAEFWDLLDARSNLTPSVSQALADRFETTYEFWQHLQAAYDAPVFAEKVDDLAFANNLEAQLRTIARAYAIGDTDEIDQALLHVTSIRHMKKQGILELLDDVDGPAEAD